MRTWSLWACLPVLYSTCTATGLMVVYFMARQCNTIHSLGWQSSEGKRYPPYISIAGNQPPASCVFSQVMNFAAFVGFLIGYLRYLQVKPKLCRPWLNIASLVLFSLACFGMTLVGNFQLSGNMDVHNAGTFLTFGLGTVFCWLQSITTLCLNQRNEGLRAAAVRFLLSASITASMLLYFALMPLGLHIHAARTQWCLVFFLLAFIGTFALEFRHFRFELVCTDHRSKRRFEAPEDRSDTATQTQDSPRLMTGNQKDTARM